ncbi:IclR family transcriptional regulator domain-containing protein [Roseateles sp. NT4]|uniref:IclR family transcriptional regulator domain-containing protein n=1 Tax=Roseateles sp. NT4 TaxID=3453715 RepID=UPI003EEB3BD8
MATPWPSTAAGWRGDAMLARDSVAAVQQVFALLEAIGHLRAATPAQLTARIGLTPHIAQRLLQTMASLGYVAEREGAWVLTAHTFELGAKALQLPELVDAAKPAMRAVADALGEAVQLGALEEGEIVCLHKIDSIRPLGLSLPIGQRLPLRGSAIGQALLAWRSDDEEFAHIRQRGFSEQRALQVHSIATPIFDCRGQAVAGLAVHVPAMRFEVAATARLAHQLRAATHAISQGLGWGSPR